MIAIGDALRSYNHEKRDTRRISSGHGASDAPHPLPAHSPSSIPGRLDLDMMVSLDHQIAWYSDSYDTSAWLLHVMDVQRAGSGRAVVHGRLYTREGELVAVTSQEGVGGRSWRRRRGGRVSCRQGEGKVI